MFKAWKNLSSRERLQLFLIPLVVAAVAVVVGVVLDKGFSVFSSHSAHLEVVDLVVGNARTENDRGKPHVEVKLHNTGDRRAILTRLRIRVHRAAFLPACLLFGGEGTYETGRYSVLLPKWPSPGYRRQNVLNEELGADEVDRFRATFETQETQIGTVAIYELSLSVLASDGETVKLGRVLVMTPFSLSNWNWSSYFATPREREQLVREGAGGPVYVEQLGLVTPGDCYRRNERIVGPFLESSAKHSAAFGRFLSHLKAREPLGPGARQEDP